MRYQGRLRNWNDDKGFGFVEPNGGGERSFVHITSFKERSRRPVEGDLIIYQQYKEPNGKFKANNVSLVADRRARSKTPKKPLKQGALIATIFCIILLAATLLDFLPMEVLFLYVLASITTFVLYAWDKSAAQDGAWRTPEANLQFLSLIGGWPGAYCAQRILRHKSSKLEFKRVYWATVIVNVSVFVWLFTEQGQQVLATIVG